MQEKNRTDGVTVGKSREMALLPESLLPALLEDWGFLSTAGGRLKRFFCRTSGFCTAKKAVRPHLRPDPCSVDQRRRADKKKCFFRGDGGN